MEYENIKVVNLEIKSNPEILLPQILNRIGYSPETMSESIRKRINKLIATGWGIIHVDFVERIAKITNGGTGGITGKGIRIDSSKWSALLNHMNSPELLCCFVLTLGESLDRLIEEKKKDSLFDAYVLDALGSLIAEQAADQMEISISKHLSVKNYECSHRFSPGYCDWELAAGQIAIFQFLQPETIGVKSMPSGVIIPEKSISAVMIGAKRVTTKSPCLFCKDQHCKYRRTD
ncbi:MAG: hypothetical protein CVU62_07955 [Deltaproteobacteria bacterium HGW-Deltaproteobacteria-2]|jgi:hypothetical protein|nr:MAG: hypothetical protein CVU62_07955 [Deltaproteobacteria bacterium HGW-Deltaproteobacteria-2]